MSFRTFRRDWLTRPIHGWAKGALPTLSKTEEEALNAGEVWWEADLFSGNPDWTKLRAVDAPRLTDEEQAFLDGPCRELCDMVDEWAVNTQTAGLSDDVWKFLREKGFFGMIIPKSHGGLGFSAYAHSEVVRFISTRSLVTAITVMVPNSLGPGELLLQFGTKAQKDHWLPRLADGRELPAFGLTSEVAGSDAAAMEDTGVVCRGDWQGKNVLGLRLNWSKRYITLAPVCTVLGLAFKVVDPDRLLGGETEIGITCALVPTDLDGVDTGRRHIPCGQMFENGPTTGTDVFIPLDHIIGGPAYAGRGWMMLMSALAAGRGISLPSLGAAATSMAAHTTGAYARIREQFGIPIAKFGGVQEGLARLAAGAYSLDAARRLTCAGLDEGHKLAVISGIMKASATHRMRDAMNDAMDIHAGKAVIDGPRNYLSMYYKALPIGITVEGANILTRSLIIFGQGAIRAHPHLLSEMDALSMDDPDASRDAFDRAFWAHVGHTFRTLGRATGRALTNGRFAPAPEGGARGVYRRMARWSAAFALTADFAFLTLGGDLKRREMISGRLGDVLSELYILSATVKRWEDEGSRETDRPLLDYTAETAFARIGRSLDEVLANLPARWAAWLLRPLILPGQRSRGPSDRLTEACAELISNAGATRDRIKGTCHDGCMKDGIQRLNAAFDALTACTPLMKRLRAAKLTVEQARADGRLSDEEAARIDDMRAKVAEVIRVDDFSPYQISQRYPDARARTPAAAAPSGTEAKEAAE